MPLLGGLGSMFGKSQEEPQLGENGVRKASDRSDQTKDEQELISFVKRKVDETRMNSSRVTHEGIWMTNIAYLLGFDGVFYDTSLKQFRTLAKGSRSIRRNRIHVNKILPSVQNRLARLCKNPPKYDVRPDSSDTEDKEAARLSLQVLNMLWEQCSINQKRIPLFMWVQECGHAFLKISFDDQLGKPMVDPETNELSYEGDIRIDIASPFEVFVDPLAKTLDEARWIVQAKVRNLDYFKTHYPENGELVKEEDAWLLSAQYEMRINSLNNRGQGQTGSQSVMKHSAIEIAYYEKRSKDYPRGRRIVTANGVLLANKELPVGELPFVKFDDVVVGGKFFSESTITHARPIQDQYNKTITLRAQWVNRLLAGKIIAAKGHGMMQESLNDQSGEIVEYNNVPNTPPPSAMSIPVIPAYAYTEDERLKEMMYDIFGINEISRGQLPSAGIPAIGMQFLMEQDDTRIGIVTENHEHAWAKLGQLMLMYVSEYFKMPRLLKIAGSNLDYTVKSFVGSDLKDNHDVIVIRGSTLPGSKVLKRQEIINAYQQGFLGDPADPKVREKVLGLLEFGDVGEMWRSYGVDMAQIKKQMTDIEQGLIPEVSEFDNNELHISEKNEYRKSDKFEKLSPVSKQILMSDIESRIQILMNQANPGLKSQMQGIQTDMQAFQNMSSQPPPELPTDQPIGPPGPGAPQ